MTNNRNSIVIIDYGLGNLGSIQNMINKVGGTSIITSDPQIIQNAKKIILPGVGAFDAGINNINKLDLNDLIKKKALVEKIPILGICLGMQLLTNKSEEGKLPGLGLIKASVIRFNFDKKNNLKIPHMGWNNIKICKKSPLFNNFEKESRFYFVHSYHVVCNQPEDVLTTTEYGYDFTSSFQNNNIFGVQFHPEKSHKFGMKLFKNFIAI